MRAAIYHLTVRESQSELPRPKRYTRIRTVRVCSLDEFRQSKKYAQLFAGNGASIVIVDCKVCSFLKRRIYRVVDGHVHRMACAALFCCTCLCVKSKGEWYHDFPDRRRAVHKWCRDCGTELVYNFELKPGIENFVEQQFRLQL